MDGDRLRPRCLWLRGEVRARWIDYHNEVERELGTCGELATIRDGASKAAENAARLAALFTVYEGRGEVSAEDVDRAAALVSWHLHEARRVFTSAAAARPENDAEALVAWVASQSDDVRRRNVQRNAPSRLRDPAVLEAAMGNAEAAGKLRIDADGTLQVIGDSDGAG